MIFKKTSKITISVEPAVDVDWVNPDGRGRIFFIITLDSPYFKCFISLFVDRIKGKYTYGYDDEYQGLLKTDEIEKAVSKHVEKRFRELDRLGRV